MSVVGHAPPPFFKRGPAPLVRLAFFVTLSLVLLVAEGYATAASCFEATGRPVFVAWDAGNLAHVVRALRGRDPAARILVCGDDDRATETRTGKNPGRLKATEAARLARGLAVFPGDELPEGGSDFNDLHQAAGLDAVRRVIEGAISEGFLEELPQSVAEQVFQHIGRNDCIALDGFDQILAHHQSSKVLIDLFVKWT